MDGGQLEKDIKFSNFFCSYCNPIVLIGSQKLYKHFDLLFCSQLLFLDLSFAISRHQHHLEKILQLKLLFPAYFVVSRKCFTAF